MHDNNTPCTTTCIECDVGPFTRNNYFTGKLLVARDFTDEQTFYVDKVRHHDQTLHGWGVVCGLAVTPHENPACRDRFVCVEPGTAIDCCGHEIIVRERECIDVTQLKSYQAVRDAGIEVAHTLQICIRYRECPTEEIPVLYDDCGCDDTKCAPNRILESYEIDLLVDPAIPTGSPHAPTLAWNNTVNIAHAKAVAFHASTNRLYVLTSEGAVFPVRTDNNSVLTPLTLPSPGLAVAVSNDGARLYVVIGPNDRSVLVLDTANMAAAPLQKLPIAGSSGSDVELAVAPGPSGRLLALIAAPGRVLAWQTDINSPGTFAPPDDVTLGPNLRSLAVASDATHAYAVDAVGHLIRVANLAPAAPGPPIPVPPNTLDLHAVAVIRSTGPDMLALLAKNEKQLLVLSPTQPGVHSVAVDNRPEALVVSPDGNWAYVLSRNAAASFVQAVNIFALGQGQSTAPGPPLPIGNGASTLALGASGETVYVPFTGDPNVAGEGGVAILEVADHDCADIFRRSLKCPVCDGANCLVLATIENYNLNDRFEAQTDPPTDPVLDTTNHVVRIDNRKGRRLLPSTQTLAEAIECLIERGGSGGVGAQGPPGPPGIPGQNGVNGQNGANGLGFDPALPKILDIGWEHDATVPFTDFQKRHKYNVHPKELLRADKPPLLTIYFNKAEMNGIMRQTFLVSIHYPLMLRQVRFTGLYNILNVDLYGFILPLGARPTPHTGETAASAFAFVPYAEFFSGAHGLFGEMWQGQNYQAPEPDLLLDLPILRVTLKGDFIWAGKPTVFDETAVLDADNLFGNVGKNRVRGGVIQGGKNPSGDLAQGGDFESWIRLGPPDVGDINPGLIRNNRLSLASGDPLTGVGVNSASLEELQALPGVNAALARKIQKLRDAAPFKSLEDFRTRLQLQENQYNAIADFVALK